MTELGSQHPEGDRSRRSQHPDGNGGQLTRTLAKARERIGSEVSPDEEVSSDKEISSDEEREMTEWEKSLEGPERAKWEKEVKIEWKKEKLERTKLVIADRKKFIEDFEVLAKVKNAIEGGYDSHRDSYDDFFQNPINQALHQTIRQFRQETLPSGAANNAFMSDITALTDENVTIRTLASQYTIAASRHVQRCENHNKEFSEYYDTYDEEGDLKPLDTKEEESNLKLNFTW